MRIASSVRALTNNPHPHGQRSPNPRVRHRALLKVLLLLREKKLSLGPRRGVEGSVVVRVQSRSGEAASQATPTTPPQGLLCAQVAQVGWGSRSRAAEPGRGTGRPDQKEGAHVVDEEEWLVKHTAKSRGRGAAARAVASRAAVLPAPSLEKCARGLISGARPRPTAFLLQPPRHSIASDRRHGPRPPRPRSPHNSWRCTELAGPRRPAAAGPGRAPEQAPIPLLLVWGLLGAGRGGAHQARRP